MRRVLLFVLIVLAAGVACDGWPPGAHAEHVLNRIGYGPDPWSLQRIQALGVEGYIEEQLHPERLDDSALEARLRRRYPALRMSLAQLRATYRVDRDPKPHEIRHQLAAAKLLRAVHSKRQLEQVLVDFWFDHFNVDATRGMALWAVAPYERDAIRPHVLGRFENLLLAVASHPAMLDYLDNSRNFREGFVRDRRVEGGNENFARELLELHTHGPAGKQTLEDVRQVARAFTGWTIADEILGASRGFSFLPLGHDYHAKRILGLSLPLGQGIEDGLRVIAYLARHPTTAVHIAGKLCRYFVAPRQTDCEYAAARRFLQTEGDLREVMRAVLGSDGFHDPRHFRAHVKRPFHFLASMGRALGVVDEDAFVTTGLAALKAMGDPLYAVGSPSGLPEDSEAWLGEDLLLQRINLADRGARGVSGFRAPVPLGTTAPLTVAIGVENRLLPGGVRATTHAELLRHLQSVSSTVRLRDATALVLAGPEFSSR